MKIKTIDRVDALEFVSKLGLGVRATNALVYIGLKSVAQLTALTEKTLLGRRNCGKKTVAEIMKAITRLRPSIESASDTTVDTRLVSDAMERMSVADLRLSVRAMAALEHLKISTVGQLVKVSPQELLSVENFGAKSLREVRSKLDLLRSRGFVLWPTEQQTADKFNPHVTRAARKLRRLRNVVDLRSNDPRFGYLIREMGLNVNHARQLADLIISRKTDPINSQLLIRRLNALIKAVRSASHMYLETELWSLTDGMKSNRNRQIIASYLALDGKPPRTLESVGLLYGMTRERVRQISKQMEGVLRARPFLPVLDCSLKTVERAAPALAGDIEDQFIQRRLTKCGFCLEALMSIARELGRELRFAVEIIHGYRIVVPTNSGGLLERINQNARAAVSRWGVATVEDVAAATGVAIPVGHKILPLLAGFRWLHEPSGWFWMANTPRNSLLTQIRKILAAARSVDVGELRMGVGRHHRQKGFAPPRRVLLELCKQLPWCRVEDERISAATALNASEVLSDSEQIILRVLKEHGPLIQRARFEELCLDAGMNRHTFGVLSSYCPLISRYATGIYGLRGAEIPVGSVEALLPMARDNKSRQLLDYGWTDDGKIRILYRLSNGMLSNGIVTVPAALKNFVQGRFTLITDDDSKIGTFVAKDNSAWGLGPFFNRRGGEAGDYLLLAFSLSRREVVVQISDSILTDKSDTSGPSAAKSDELEFEKDVVPSINKNPAHQGTFGF